MNEPRSTGFDLQGEIARTAGEVCDALRDHEHGVATREEAYQEAEALHAAVLRALAYLRPLPLPVTDAAAGPVRGPDHAAMSPHDEPNGGTPYTFRVERAGPDGAYRTVHEREVLLPPDTRSAEERALADAMERASGHPAQEPAWSVDGPDAAYLSGPFNREHLRLLLAHMDALAAAPGPEPSAG